MFYLTRSNMKSERQPIDWPAYYEERAQKFSYPVLKQFYQQGMIAADTPLSDVEFVALDFETTGLNTRSDSIVSIGVVPFTLQRIHLPEAKHWLVNPHQEIPDETVIVHGITESRLAGKPDLLTILPKLLAIMAGKVVVAHHIPIERNFLNQAIKERVEEECLFPMIDTMAIENQLCRKGWRDFWLRLTGRPRVSIRLANSRIRYGLPVYRAHHAETDALATAELFQAQVRYHFEASQMVEELWR